jgi:phage terminase large subunit
MIKKKSQVPDEDIGPEEMEAFLQKCQADPVWFVENVLGKKLWSKQKEILEAIRDNRKVCVKSCNGSGKCRRISENVILYDGSVVKAGNLIGKTFVLPTFDNKRKFAVSHATDNGIQPIYAVTTSSNRRIEVTGNHKLYKATAVRNRGIKPQADGWTEVNDLKVADLLLVPTKLNVDGLISREVDEVKLCGYLIGDGGTTTSAITFTQTEGKQRTEFIDIVAKMRCKCNYRSDHTGFNVSGIQCGKNRVLDLVREWKMYGVKSKNKRFPEFVWHLPNDQLAVFLNRYFSCDGNAYSRIEGNHQNACISVASASEQMIRDVEIAMLRLGISGRTRYKRSKCNDKYFDSWEWAVMDCQGINLFSELVGIYGKEEAVQKCVDNANNRKFNVNWKYINAPEGYHWEFIKSIEYIGEHPTVNISVEDTHTYVTTFVEHNSFLAACAVLWFLFSFPPSIVITTSPTWRQTAQIVWSEVRNSYNRSRFPLGGTMPPKSPEIQIVQDQWAAFGLSTNEPDRFQGYHSRNIFVIVDEAAGVPPEIFEAVDGLLTSENPHLLLIGNPTNVSGEFYNAFKDSSFCKISISAFDTPNFTTYGITERDIEWDTWHIKLPPKTNKRLYEKDGIRPAPGQLHHGERYDVLYPGLINPMWVYERYRSWGPEHPAYQSRVLGQFPTMGDNCVIPLSWIEAAQARYEDVEPGDPIEAGVDIARFGSDATCICIRKGMKIMPLQVFHKLDLMESAGIVARAIGDHNISNTKIDEIGMGGGPVDRLLEQKLPVQGVNVARSPQDPEHFANLRTELWWQLREKLDPNGITNPNPIALPKDEELLAELSGVLYKYTSKGQMAIEPKDETRKRINRSPDRADALVLCVGQPGKMVPIWAPVFRKKEGGSQWRGGFGG